MKIACAFQIEILRCGFSICNLRIRRCLAAQSCTEGSNPSLSAMTFILL